MRHIFFIILASVWLQACEISNQQSSDPITLQEAEAVLKKWSQAYYARDTALLDEVLHSRYTYSGADGSKSDKAQVMNNLATSDFHVQQMDLYDLEIDAYQDVAIVRGWEEMRYLSGGDSGSLKLRFIDFYIRENGRIQALGTQSFGME